jgi:hypothetical protein
LTCLPLLGRPEPKHSCTVLCIFRVSACAPDGAQIDPPVGIQGREHAPQRDVHCVPCVIIIIIIATVIIIDIIIDLMSMMRATI